MADRLEQTREQESTYAEKSEEYTTKLESISQEQIRLEEQADALREQNNDLERRAAEAEATDLEIKSARQHLDEDKAKLEKHQAELERRAAGLAEQAAQLEGQQSHIDGFAKSLTERLSALQTLESRTAGYVEELATREKELQALSENLRERESSLEIAHSEEARETPEAELSLPPEVAHQEISRLQSALRHVRGELDELVQTEMTLATEEQTVGPDTPDVTSGQSQPIQREITPFSDTALETDGQLESGTPSRPPVASAWYNEKTSEIPLLPDYDLPEAHEMPTREMTLTPKQRLRLHWTMMRHRWDRLRVATVRGAKERWPKQLNPRWTLALVVVALSLAAGVPFWGDSQDLQTTDTASESSVAADPTKHSPAPLSHLSGGKSARIEHSRLTLSREAVVAAVSDNSQEDLQRCWKSIQNSKAFDKNQPLLLGWTISADGDVSEAEIFQGKEPLDGEIAECVNEAVSTWRFPTAARESVVRNYPVELP